MNKAVNFNECNRKITDGKSNYSHELPCHVLCLLTIAAHESQFNAWDLCASTGKFDRCHV